MTGVPGISRTQHFTPSQAIDIWLDTQKNEIQRLIKLSARHAIQIGQRLIEIKQRLREHNLGKPKLEKIGFEIWCSANIGLGAFTCQRYMKVARLWGHLLEQEPCVLDSLAPSVLIELSRATKEVQEIAIAQIEKGARPTIETVQLAIAQPENAELLFTQAVGRPKRVVDKKGQTRARVTNSTKRMTPEIRALVAALVDRLGEEDTIEVLRNLLRKAA